MAEIKTWAFSACAALIAGGIAQMLIPKSNMEKIFKLTVSIFFLCCLLSPFIIMRPDLMLDFSQESAYEMEQKTEELDKILQEQSMVAYKASIEKIIIDKCAQMGIKHKSITINIYNEGQSDTPVIDVELILDISHQQEHKEIKEEFEKFLELKVLLGYE